MVLEAAAARGLKVGPMAVPLSPEKQRDMDEFRSWFKGWLPVMLKECGKEKLSAR